MLERPRRNSRQERLGQRGGEERAVTAPHQVGARDELVVDLRHVLHRLRHLRRNSTGPADGYVSSYSTTFSSRASGFLSALPGFAPLYLRHVTQRAVEVGVQARGFVPHLAHLSPASRVLGGLASSVSSLSTADQ